MGMTIDEAIEFKKHGYHMCLSVFEDDMDAMNAHIGKCAEYDKLAFDTMCKYQKIFDKYEILTASFEDSDSPEVRSKKVDEFCIDTMRGLLGEYYVERIKEDGNDN